MADTIFCRGEGRRFPAADFVYRNGGCIHVLNGTPAHYADSGLPENDDGEVPVPLQIDLEGEEPR